MATVYEFNYTGSEQSVTLKPGKYKLECWGAKGGNWGGGECGAGGYSYGELTLKKEVVLYIYTGQLGYDANNTLEVFNGGGYGKDCTGGGATDIRIIGGDWNSEEGLLSRIIVAGGSGGGGGGWSSGVGGGYIGGYGKGSNSAFSCSGRQNTGGMALEFNNEGLFGKGGCLTITNVLSRGGGGGWFGGACSDTAMGGGGSGYVLTRDSYKPQGYIPTSEYWLENADTIAGGNTSGTYGYAQITLLQALPFLNISSYNSTQATFKADHTDPTLLTKIEYFIDDVLKGTITTDLTLEKTINYTLEDNALHTLKIVVTDSANATAEKVVSISKNIMPLGDDASLQDIASKIKEMKHGLINGKNSIINVLALKNIESSLNNSLVELSEKVKESFNSSDASVQDLTNKLTQANNTITQLNGRYKIASGLTDSIYTSTVEKALVYNSTYEKQFYNWITISNLGFKPNIFYAECDYVNSYTKSKNKLFVFACCDLSTSSGKDFIFTCDISLKSTDNDYTTTSHGLYYNNKLDVKFTDNLIHIPAFTTVNAVASYH
ncbi:MULTISPECIES: glycine rich domain-containing protein [unclassified Clostridioides]|uniref:glycine rich domain-containing protein n=1 Tax=unclassified Clostridioides TaxID=2635829 RepID=UPI0038A1B50E